MLSETSPQLSTAVSNLTSNYVLQVTHPCWKGKVLENKNIFIELQERNSCNHEMKEIHDHYRRPVIQIDGLRQEAQALPFQLYTYI